MLKRLFIFFLLLIETISASAIYFNDALISTAYDFKEQKAINVVDKLPNNINEIWASTWINSALDDSNITISWYYIDKDGEKSIIYQEDLKVSGTKPIVSSLDLTKVEYLPITSYIVEFNLDNRVKRVAKFKIYKSSKNSINNASNYNELEGSIEEDSKLIKNISSHFLTIKPFIKDLSLYRVISQDKKVSIILPTAWGFYAVKYPNIFYIKSSDDFIDLKVKVYKESLKSSLNIKEAVKDYLVSYLKSSDKVLKKLKITNLANSTIASIAIKREGDLKKDIHFFSLKVKKNTLVMSESIVNLKNYKLGEFINTLTLASIKLLPND